MAGRGSRTHIDATAFHEAGHAVAALWAGRLVSRAQVRRDLPGNGGVWMILDKRPNPFNPALSVGSARAAWQHSLATRTSEIRCLLAGPLSEAKALGKPMRSLGSRSDFERCQKIATDLEAFWLQMAGLAELPPLDTVVLLNEERCRVRRWLGRPKVWYLVHRVADRLSREGLLYGADLIRELAAIQRPRGQGMLRLEVASRPDRRNGRQGTRGVAPDCVGACRPRVLSRYSGWRSPGVQSVVASISRRPDAEMVTG